MSDISPFVISISNEQITDLNNRIANTRWPDAETTGDWNQGVPLAYIKELVQYWGGQYDQQRLANRLNAFDNFKTNLLGLNIHFMHIRSRFSSKGLRKVTFYYKSLNYWTSSHK